MIAYVALIIGIVAGLRALTAPAAVSLAGYFLLFDISNSALWFMASIWSALIFTALACFELYTDKLPKTPSRKTPAQFIARVLMGALAGGTVGAAHNAIAMGLCCGIVGAVVGTLTGAWARKRMALSFSRDYPAALIEDATAIILAVASVFAV